MNTAACPSIQELEAYFDGELPAARAAEVRAHLVSCAACAAELSRLEQTSQLFRDAPSPRLSQISLHRLHANLSKTIKQEREKDFALRRIARACSAVAACVVLAGTTFLMTRGGRPAQTATVAAPPPWTDVAVAVDANDASASQAAAPNGGIALAEYYLASTNGRGDELSN